MTRITILGPRDNPGYRVAREWGWVTVRLKDPIHEGDEPYAAIAWMLSMERRSMERKREPERTKQ